MSLTNKRQYYFSSLSKFHYSIFIQGWYRDSGTCRTLLRKVSCRHKNVTALISTSNEDYRIPSDSTAVSFEIQLLLKESAFPEDFLLDLEFEDDSYDTLTTEFIRKRVAESQASQSSISLRYRELINDPSFKRILDIGGRARSGLDRSKEFIDKEVVVVDILAGDNVDIVCDAHQLSSRIKQGSIDAVYCVSVFEHLIMPWKVALEMNKVMRMGGIALIHTHQTIGMHDIPWDFYRFSDNSWKGIFNNFSGFEILQAELNDLQYIIPFFWKERYASAEKSAGFEGSTVLVKKIGESSLEWPLTAYDVTKDMYPDHPDNNIIELAEKY